MEGTKEKIREEQAEFEKTKRIANGADEDIQNYVQQEEALRQKLAEERRIGDSFNSTKEDATVSFINIKYKLTNKCSRMKLMRSPEQLKEQRPMRIVIQSKSKKKAKKPRMLIGKYKNKITYILNYNHKSKKEELGNKRTMFVDEIDKCKREVFEVNGFNSAI